MGRSKVLLIEQDENFNNYKQQQRLKANKVLMIYFSILVFVVVVMLSGVFYFFSENINIGLVSFTGLKNVSKVEILELSELSHKDNYILANIEDLESSILRHPLIEEVTVSKGFEKISVSVREKELIGCVVKENGSYPVAINGEIIKDQSLKSDLCQGVYFYDVIENLEFNPLELFVSELMSLDNSFLKLIESVYQEPLYQDVNRFSINMKDGNMIKVNSYTMADKLPYYETMVSQIQSIYGNIKGVFNLDVGDSFQSFAGELPNVADLEDEVNE